nr:hypothetical protein CFP56_52732 [Quercus suber]
MIEIPGRSTKRRRTIVRGEEADQTYHLHQVGVRGVESQRQATEVRGAGARVFVIAAIFVTGGLTRDAGGAGQSVSESDVEGAEGGDLAGLGDGGGGAGGTEPDDAVADAVDRALEQAVALRQERGHGHGGEEDGAEADSPPKPHTSYTRPPTTPSSSTARTAAPSTVSPTAPSPATSHHTPCTLPPPTPRPRNH